MEEGYSIEDHSDGKIILMEEDASMKKRRTKVRRF
jgi:hypothetical protein